MSDPFMSPRAHGLHTQHAQSTNAVMLSRTPAIGYLRSGTRLTLQDSVECAGKDA